MSCLMMALRRRCRSSTVAAAAGALLLLSAAAAAAAPEAAALSFSRGGARAAVPEGRLAVVRGGYDVAGGTLQLSVALQRELRVDGQVVAASALQFCGLQGCATTAVNAPTALQRGPGNSLPPSGLGMPQMLVVQNTLERQHIQALTTLDISANSLQLFKNSALQAVMGGALAAAARR